MKHFSLLTLLLLFMGMYVFSQEITVEVPTLSAPAIGQTIDVPVILSGAGESGVPISACDINIAFDQSVLTYSGLVNFSPLAVSNEWVFNGTGGTVYANWIEPTVTTTVAFPDATVLFYVRFTYTGGSSTLIYTKNEFYDVNYNLVPTNTINGAVNGVALTKTLNLTGVILEGLYAGGGVMNQAQGDAGAQFGPGVADEITVELHDATTYATILHSATVALSTSGAATVSNIPGSLNGNYYITIRHRNSIETTTANPVSFAGAIVNQSFALPADVYGGNLQLFIDGVHAIFGGDVFQDGTIDTSDMSQVDNDAASYISGYVPTDADGSGGVDTSDMTIVDNNSSAYVGSILP